MTQVWGSGLKVLGLGFRGQGVWGLGSRVVKGLGCLGLGLGTVCCSKVNVEDIAGKGFRAK